MNKKGFTIVEVLVTLFILGLVLYTAYLTYIKLLKGFKSESEKISSQIESLVGLEILRLDLEHIGYGIPVNETNPIIAWDSSTKTLTIRSTLNNTNEITRGYLVAFCNSGNLEIRYDGRETASASFVSIMNSETKEYFDYGEISGIGISPDSGTCTSNKVYLAFPIRKEVADNTGGANGCSVSRCELITYTLSNSNLIDRCNINTYNLIRRVGGSTTGEPVLNCVADWALTFDIDTNGNGIIDSGEENQTTLPTSNSDIRTKLKAINVYILIQEGKYDPEYTYSQAVTCGSNMCVEVNGVNLTLPSDYENYRWKPLMIKVKPMNL